MTDTARLFRELEQALEAARAELAAVTTDAALRAEGEAYLLRSLAAALGDALLGHLANEAGLTEATAVRGGPNPDYQVLHAPVDPSQRYKVRGRLNGSERIGIGLYRFTPAGVADLAAYRAFDPRNVAADGGFALELGSEAQGREALAIPPDARVMIVRILHRSPDREVGRVRLDGAVPPPLPRAIDPGALAARVGHGFGAGVRQFAEWTRLIRSEPNTFLSPPPSIARAVQGDPDTEYRFAAFELAEDGWLEVVLPAGLDGYWSLHVYNVWLEAVPGAGTGDHVAVADEDGQIRIGLGPGTRRAKANWLDTGDRRDGILIFRRIGAGALGSLVSLLHRGAG